MRAHGVRAAGLFEAVARAPGPGGASFMGFDPEGLARLARSVAERPAPRDAAPDPAPKAVLGVRLLPA